MKKGKSSYDESATSTAGSAAKVGRNRLSVSWFERESFDLKVRIENCFKLDDKINSERTYYVKLVIDVPNYRSDRSRAGVCGRGGYSGVDRPSVVCRVSCAVSGLSHLWPPTGCLKARASKN
jgi:hypothetical protein